MLINVRVQSGPTCISSCSTLLHVSKKASLSLKSGEQEGLVSRKMQFTWRSDANCVSTPFRLSVCFLVLYPEFSGSLSETSTTVTWGAVFSGLGSNSTAASIPHSSLLTSAPSRWSHSQRERSSWCSWSLQQRCCRLLHRPEPAGPAACFPPPVRYSWGRRCCGGVRFLEDGAAGSKIQPFIQLCMLHPVTFPH